MNPREIEVHIEELVLHGFAPNERWSVADALENELRARLTADGVPAAWSASPERLDLETVRLTNSQPTGRQIAAAICEGGRA